MSTIRSLADVAVSAAATVAALLTTSAPAPSSIDAPAPANPDPQLFKNPQGNPYFPLPPRSIARELGIVEEKDIARSCASHSAIARSQAHDSLRT